MRNAQTNFYEASGKVFIKSERDLEAMARAGRLASVCLQWILEQVTPGMTTQDIDDLQVDFARREGVIAAPLHYRGFPKSICTAVNDVICHGIPSKKQVLREGDIVGIDVTLIVEGFHGDNASTIPVGVGAPEVMRLLEVTLESNRLAIAAVRPGARLGDVGHAIQSYVEPLGYSVVRDFVGHGVGRGFHEAPQVPHYGRPGRGLRLSPGLTFTIEPMINEGTWEMVLLRDGWTAVTADGKLSAQYEHTLAVTEDGVRVLTVQNEEGTWEPPGRWYPPALTKA
ncbi:MAG TPA: type I methionyl aminopeptidase [Vicinamibacteria bacterium]|nr:type I methionyl aminopeptidase [Vicinamibacteria bacterium]